MQRRQFIKNLSALGLSSALPLSSIASGIGGNTSSLINIKRAFNLALAQQPALIGLTSAEQDYASKSLQIEGKIPQDLNGTFIRNGPAKHERGSERYRYWFEGDGMLQKFDFADGQVRHQGNFIRTAKYVQEQQAKRFLFSGPDSRIQAGKPVSNPAQINVANTNVIAVNDELWALWEAGAATAIDPETMDYKHQVNLGQGNQYGNQLKGMPFSAHPRISSDGEIWNFGLSPNGQILLYHLSASGKLKKLSILKHRFEGGMLHDFLMTEKHLLIVLPSLERNRNIQGHFASIQYASQRAMQVLVVDKNTLTISRRYELPPGFAWHFGNAWENNNGDIKFDASLYKSLDVVHEKSAIMEGKHINRPGNGYTVVFTLHQSGKVSQHRFDDISEFPRVCPHLTGKPNRLLFHVSGRAENLWAHRLVARDLMSAQADMYDFGDEYIVEEHVPVCPDPVKEAGYLIGTALHIPSKRTCVNVFNMQNVSDGPIARGWLSHHLPLGLHGNFVSAAST